MCTFSNRLICPVFSQATLQREKWAKLPIVTQAGVAVLKRFLVDDHVAVHRHKAIYYALFEILEADKRGKQALRRWWSHTHTHFMTAPNWNVLICIIIVAG